MLISGERVVWIMVHTHYGILILWSPSQECTDMKRVSDILDILVIEIFNNFQLVIEKHEMVEFYVQCTN